MESDATMVAAWCDAMATRLELPMAAADRAAVLANLRFIMAQMKLLADFPLDDGIEPANIFRA